MNNSAIFEQSILKLFDKGSSVLFRWKNDSVWSIEYVSKNVLKLLGYTEEEFLQNKITYAQTIAPKFLSFVQEEVRIATLSSVDFFEHKPYKIITKDKKEKWVLDQTLIERDKDGNVTHYLGYISDITEVIELAEEHKRFEQRVRIAIESIDDGIWDWDLKTDEVYYSHAWKKMLGYEDDEIENKLESFFELVHFDDREKVQKEIESHLKNNNFLYSVEIRLLCKSGEYKWILSRAKALLDANGQATRMLGSHIDISQQKETQRQLKQSQAIAKVGLWELYHTTDILKWTDETFEIFEIDKEQVSPSYKKILNLVHPEDRVLVDGAYRDSLITKKPYEIAHRLLFEDGRIKYLLEKNVTEFKTDGTPLITRGTVQDITEFSLLDIAMRDEKKFVETIIKTANAVIAIIDSSGKMLRLNSYGEKISGYTQDELSKEPYNWKVLFQNSANKDILDIIEDAKNGITRSSYQAECISKNGEHRVFEWSVALVKKEDGSMDYISIIGIDITQSEKQKSFLQLLINSQSNMIALADNNELIYVNQAVLDFYDLKTLEELKEIHGCFCNTFLENDYSFHMGKVEKSEEWIKEIQKLLPEKRIVTIICQKSKKVKIFRVNIENSLKDNTHIMSFIDVSETILKQQELEYKSNHDTLTKAYNRSYFYDNFQNLFSKDSHGDEFLGIAVIDIDHFKYVNDTYGHDVGDQILIKLVQTIWDNTRESDTLIRWGGEEFILLMPTKSQEALKKALDSLRVKISQTTMPFIGSITVSIGATFHHSSKSIEESIKNADLCLYKAKNSGRNRVEIS